MSDQPAWLKVALGAGVGFLCGVLLIVVLAVTGSDGRGGSGRTTAAPAATVVRPALPDVVGLRLDVARKRLEGEGFAVEHRGGGVLGVVVEANWEVRAQTPGAGARVAPGSTVEVFVDRP